MRRRHARRIASLPLSLTLPHTPSLLLRTDQVAAVLAIALAWAAGEAALGVGHAAPLVDTFVAQPSGPLALQLLSSLPQLPQLVLWTGLITTAGCALVEALARAAGHAATAKHGCRHLVQPYGHEDSKNSIGKESTKGSIEALL